MNLIDQSLQIAIKYHNGHVNSHNGEAYMLHLHRVFMDVRDRGGSEIQQAAAWLHDSIEDTDLNAGILAGSEGIPDELVRAVLALTHGQGESYEHYLYRVNLDPVAKLVKQCDLLDNFRRNHEIKDEATRLRMAKKYSRGMDILGQSV